METTSYFPIKVKSKIRARHIRKSPSRELPVLILAIISRSVEEGMNRGTPPESMSRNKWLGHPLNIPRLASSRCLDPNLSNRPMKISITGKIMLPIREWVKPLRPIRSLTYRFCSFRKEEVMALMRCLPADIGGTPKKICNKKTCKTVLNRCQILLEPDEEFRRPNRP